MSDRKTRFLNAQTVCEAVVPIPEMGGLDVLVRGLVDEDYSWFIDLVLGLSDEERGKIVIREAAVMVQKVTYDPETRERMFTEAEIPQLKRHNPLILRRIAQLGIALSNATTEKEVAEAKKDFCETGTSKPSSASQSSGAAAAETS